MEDQISISEDYFQDDPVEQDFQVDDEMYHEEFGYQQEEPEEEEQEGGPEKEQNEGFNACIEEKYPQVQPQQYARHRRRTKPYKCKECKLRFGSNSSLTTHYNTFHQGIAYTCVFCDYSTGNKSHLKVHVEGVHEKKEIHCEYCDYFCFNKGSLWTHVKAAHAKRKFNCPKCQWSSSYKQNLTHHIRSIHEKVRYPCDFCGKEFKLEKTLMKHVQLSHPDLTPKNFTFTCHYCVKTFKFKETLKRHMDAIHGEKFDGNNSVSNLSSDESKPLLHRCPICEESFETKDSYIQHKETAHLFSEPLASTSSTFDDTSNMIEPILPDQPEELDESFAFVDACAEFKEEANDDMIQIKEEVDDHYVI